MIIQTKLTGEGKEISLHKACHHNWKIQTFADSLYTPPSPSLLLSNAEVSCSFPPLPPNESQQKMHSEGSFSFDLGCSVRMWPCSAVQSLLSEMSHLIGRHSALQLRPMLLFTIFFFGLSYVILDMLIVHHSSGVLLKCVLSDYPFIFLICWRFK